MHQPILQQRVTLILLDQNGNPIEFDALPEDVASSLRRSVTKVAYFLASSSSSLQSPHLAR